MLQTVDFLSRQPNPTDGQINAAMDDFLCRCGSHPRIKKAIKMAAEIAETGLDDTSYEGVHGKFYGFDNMVVEHAMTRLPVIVGAWRSVGYSFNTYVTETPIDEMAVAAKKDPALYRLD